MRSTKSVALCFIFLLAGAEAVRTVENVNQLEALSLALHEGKGKETAFSGSSQALQPEDASASLLKHLEAINASSHRVMSGEGLLWRKYCMLTCPTPWIKMAYHTFQARADASKVVEGAFAAGGSLSMLPVADLNLAEAYTLTMRQATWTFLKTLDNSAMQRVVLTLVVAPFSLFRKLTTMQPLGLCVFKHAWKDLQHSESYKQKSPRWWKFFFLACPEDAAEPTPSFADESSAKHLLGGMVDAISEPEGLEVEEEAAKWRGASTHAQCVKLFVRKNVWLTRALQIEKGILSWIADPMKCKGVGALDRIKYNLGHKRYFALEFVTAPPGAEAVQLVDNSQCVTLKNPYRQFKFCGTAGESMAKAKEVLDQHLSILGTEHRVFQMTAKVGRLVAASAVADDEHERKDLDDSIDQSGDSSVDGLASEIGELSGGTESTDAATAIQILEQVKKASSLIATGKVQRGSALLQEAYAASHSNMHLVDIMSGKVHDVTKTQGAELVRSSSGDGGLGATLAGLSTLSIVMLGLFLFVCIGGIGCAALIVLGTVLGIKEGWIHYTEKRRLRLNATNSSSLQTFPVLPRPALA